MHPRTLEEYFYESCIIPEGDDIDDEDFKIRVIYKIFEKSSYSSSEPLEVTGNVLFSTERKRMLFLLKTTLVIIPNLYTCLIQNEKPLKPGQQSIMKACSQKAQNIIMLNQMQMSFQQLALEK